MAVSVMALGKFTQQREVAVELKDDSESLQLVNKVILSFYPSILSCGKGSSVGHMSRCKEYPK